MTAARLLFKLVTEEDNHITEADEDVSDNFLGSLVLTSGDFNNLETGTASEKSAGAHGALPVKYLENKEEHYFQVSGG